MTVDLLTPVEKAWATRRMRQMVASTLPNLPDSLCRNHEDPDLWHPIRPNRRQEFKAIGICRSCPAITECLAYALRANPIHGIWGGTTLEMREFMVEMRLSVFVE